MGTRFWTASVVILLAGMAAAAQTGTTDRAANDKGDVTNPKVSSDILRPGPDGAFDEAVTRVKALLSAGKPNRRSKRCSPSIRRASGI
jgi:hypothetical protein